MSKRDIDREHMEIVFGLTGGELHDGPRGGFAYTYDGPPDYAHDQFSDLYSADYMTVLHYGLFTESPSCFEHAGTLYRRVVGAIYRNSGEAECLCNDCEALDMAAYEMGDRCPVCENDVREPGRRYVYIGEGWSEVVYRGTPLHVLDAAAGI
ncbi:MAG: hypothetical protein QUS11_06665 [Candidatus Fermentibacter sp.]|nr:hypothetical protein [Candidatus Fermentibacter sp.]